MINHSPMTDDTKYEAIAEERLKAGASFRMNASAKARVRGAVLAYARSRGPVVSPLSVFRMRFVAGTLALALIVGGGTTAAAAESALPGDLLYGVKVSVVEPARTLAALSDEDRASVEAELAERRLAEAEELSAAGTLEDSVKEELDERYEKHVARAELAAGRAKDASVAPFTRALLSARLSAHREAVVAFDDSEEGEVEDMADATAPSVSAKAAAPETAAFSLMASEPTPAPEALRAAVVERPEFELGGVRVAALAKKVASALTEAEKRIAKAREDAPESRLLADADAALTRARTLSDEGAAFLASGNLPLASSSYVDALASARKAEILAKGAKKDKERDERRKKESKDDDRSSLIDEPKSPSEDDSPERSGEDRSNTASEVEVEIEEEHGEYEVKVRGG